MADYSEAEMRAYTAAGCPSSMGIARVLDGWVVLADPRAVVWFELSDLVDVNGCAFEVTGINRSGTLRLSGHDAVRPGDAIRPTRLANVAADRGQR